MSTKKEYFLTLEELEFVLTFNDANLTPEQSLKAYGERKLKNLLSYYGKLVTEQYCEKIVDNILKGINIIPEINLVCSETLHFIYYKNKKDILKFHDYFHKKGFHLVDYFLETIQTEKVDYTTRSLTNILNIFLSEKNYNPEPEKVLTLLRKLSNNSNKSTIPDTLNLFQICFNKEKAYSKEDLLDIFFEFSKNYKSFPKTSFKKINEVASQLKESAPEKWNRLLKDEEFNKKFNNTSVDSYEVFDCITKRFYFDINLLSIKNGGFKINDFKNNFGNLFSFLSEYSRQPENKTNISYQNERSFLNFYIIIEEDSQAKQRMQVFENLIQIIYENSCKNIPLKDVDIKKMFENISLMQNLDRDLSEVSNKKTKAKKI